MADLYWDTKGVTNIAALENDKIGLKFAGEDGTNRVLTIPASHAVNLILSLTDFATKIAKTHNVGDAISDVQRFIVQSIGVGAAPDGSEFSLVVTTVDQLEAHFALPAKTTAALAAGLISTLAEHGLEPESLESQGSSHDP